jgi:hypothetical protein
VQGLDVVERPAVQRRLDGAQVARELGLDAQDDGVARGQQLDDRPAIVLRASLLQSGAEMAHLGDVVGGVHRSTPSPTAADRAMDRRGPLPFSA